MDQPRDWQLELLTSLRADVTTLREDLSELKASTRHLTSDVAELRTDIRRLDDRIFQLLLVQIATLITALGSLGTSLAALLAD